jgi:hypothetical protein
MLQSIERQSPTAGDGAIGAWHGSGVVVLGFRNLTHYRVAHCSAASHSTPGQHVVDQRCRVDDQVDSIGQPLAGPAVQAEVGFALIPRDDLQVAPREGQGAGDQDGNSTSSASGPSIGIGKQQGSSTTPGCYRRKSGSSSDRSRQTAGAPISFSALT